MKLNTACTTEDEIKIMKREKTVESRYNNEFSISPEDKHVLYDKVERNIGRYPIEFRHYENYDNYKLKNEFATL